MKVCMRCEEPKGLEAFSRDASRKDGHQRWCKPCVADYQRTHDDVGGSWREEQRERLIAEQGPRCAISGCSADGVDIEHDHRLPKSNVLSIRGLACRSHNWRLGVAGDQTMPLIQRALHLLDLGEDATPVLRMAEYTAGHDAKLVNELLKAA